VAGRWRGGGEGKQAMGTNTTAGIDAAPPMRVDHRTGNVVPVIHYELSHTWAPTPIGEMPHHTLAFPVPAADTAGRFRYIRLRQLTHAGHTQFGEEWCGHDDMYVQGFELYGQLAVQVLQVARCTLLLQGVWCGNVSHVDFYTACTALQVAQGRPLHYQP